LALRAPIRLATARANTLIAELVPILEAEEEEAEADEADEAEEEEDDNLPP
jgi:hypothetical protein